MPAKIRGTRVAGSRPTPTGMRVESESQVTAWQHKIRTMRASPSKFMHLTEKQYIVGETTIELVMMDHRQPSRAEIAEAVRRKGYSCCEETVRRTHTQLRDAGLLAWTQQYDIGWRMTQFQVRVRQARQTVNDYEFYLPEHVTFILPEACGRVLSGLAPAIWATRSDLGIGPALTSGSDENAVYQVRITGCRGAT